ncbi:MAG: hypothetical protein WC222_00865 [Parachlamydiales bacterium]|jgi:hypothetical protein
MLVTEPQYSYPSENDRIIEGISNDLNSVEYSMSISSVMWGEEGLIRFGHAEHDINTWSWTLSSSLDKLNLMESESSSKYDCLNKIIILREKIYSFL